MTQQVETATVVATITAPGNGALTITGKYISGSPVSVVFAVLLGDDAAATALSARTALALNSAVSNQYQVSGATDKIILTDRQSRANDTTLNIAVADGTCTGITAAATSANTTAGTGLSNAYATLDEFKYYLSGRGNAGNLGTDAVDDSVIEQVLNGVSRYIDGQCGRRFYANTVDETRYYTPEDSGWMFVDDLSTDPTSVAVDYDGATTYGTTISSTDMTLLPANAALDSLPYTRIELRWDCTDYFPTSYRNSTRVVGKFGYPAVPVDIAGVCLAIAQNVYNNRLGQSNAGNVSVTAAGVVIRPQDVPEWAQVTLTKYRRYV